MNLLALGATGGKGRALVEQALEQGRVVTALTRNPRTTHKNLRVVKGNIMNYGSVEAAISGQDAVSIFCEFVRRGA